MSMSFHAKVIGQKLRGSFCEQPNGPEDSLNEHKLHGKGSALLVPDSYKRMIIMKMCLARLEKSILLYIWTKNDKKYCRHEIIALITNTKWISFRVELIFNKSFGSKRDWRWIEHPGNCNDHR